MADIKTEVSGLLRQVSEALILPRFQNLHADQINTKTSATDFVTIADQEAEQWLTPRLQAIFDCRVVGEEACADSPGLYEQAGSGWAWTVDPIDGTSNFVKGRERFCTMVALTKDGIPQQAWIYQQLSETLFYAATGAGAWQITGADEIQLNVAPTSADLDMMIGSGNTLGVKEPQKSVIQTRLRGLQGRRFPGSAGIQGTLIARGEEDYMIHGNCTPWDHAPVDLLCREAGGHSAMVHDGSAYRAGTAGSYMVTATHTIWTQLHSRIWRGEETENQANDT